MQAVVAAMLLCAALTAQGQTIVVDSRHRAGTDYSDLAAAVAAAPDGSTLIVRDGDYAGVDIAGKGLTILADGEVTVGGASADGAFLTVRDTAATQTVLVRGIRPASARRIEVRDAKGPVTIDGEGAALLLGNRGPAVVVQRSKQVAFRQWTAEGNSGADVTDSVVVFESCVLRGSAAGGPAAATRASAPAVRATGSHLQLVHTPAFGGNGLASGDDVLGGSPAVLLGASCVRVLGLLGHVLAGGEDPTLGRQPAIAGIGVARISPAISVQGTEPGPGVLVTRPEMPSLLATTAGPGGVLTATRHGMPGMLCAIGISLRGTQRPAPTFADPVWMRESTFCIEALGRASANGVFRVQKQVPADPALRGYQIVWQAADLGPSGVLAVSNPSPSFVR